MRGPIHGRQAMAACVCWAMGRAGLWPDSGHPLNSEVAHDSLSTGGLLDPPASLPETVAPQPCRAFCRLPGNVDTQTLSFTPLCGTQEERSHRPGPAGGAGGGSPGHGCCHPSQRGAHAREERAWSVPAVTSTPSPFPRHLGRPLGAPATSCRPET